MDSVRTLAKFYNVDQMLYVKHLHMLLFACVQKDFNGMLELVVVAKPSVWVTMTVLRINAVEPEVFVLIPVNSWEHVVEMLNVVSETIKRNVLVQQDS